LHMLFGIHCASICDFCSAKFAVAAWSLLCHDAAGW